MKDLTDLTERDILTSLDILIKTKDYQSSKYGAWYHGHFISPARVISKAYELKHIRLDRDVDLSTESAQRRLLDLGIPIVEETSSGFFTSRELKSFSRLVQRVQYNPSNAVDRNIGYFLNQTVWEKTKKWATGLRKLGWVISGNKHWNKRNGSNGQAYKNYTWWRIYPKQRTNDLLCFTIGIHDDSTLVYKLDRKWQDSFFNDEKNNLFHKLADHHEIEWQKVTITEIQADNYGWEKLIQASHEYFTSLLDTYYSIADELFSEYNYRLMRLTYNKNNWEIPSGHSWRIENQGKTSVAFENQYGFGHEEWLFNKRYEFKEYQYGYIRGVSHMSWDVEVIDRIVLYTINPYDKLRYLVAEINNVIAIEEVEEEIEKVREVFSQNQGEAIEELKSVNAYYEIFEDQYLLPNVKFKWEDVKIFNQPIPALYLNDAKFNRYQPYIVTPELLELLEEDEEKESSLIFNAGKAKSSGNYTKQVKGGKKKVNRSHTEITDTLYEYLNQVLGYDEDNLSSEKTRVGGAIIDFAVKEPNDSLILFEAKTSSTGLRNIRQALGQIFEYALLDGNANISKMVIVGPAILTELELDYLNRLRSLLDVELDYWAFDKKSETLENKFIKY